MFLHILLSHIQGATTYIYQYLPNSSKRVNLNFYKDVDCVTTKLHWFFIGFNQVDCKSYSENVDQLNEAEQAHSGEETQDPTKISWNNTLSQNWA